MNLPLLAEGARGNAVRAVQLIIGGLQADGDFGPLTKAAVETFQRAHALTADGVVGTHTWGTLLGAPQ